MQNLKKATNELVYKTEIESQKTNSWYGVGGSDRTGDWGRRVHTTVYKIDKQETFLYSTGNSAQYSLIT